MDLAFDIEEVESRVRSLAPLVKRIAKHIAASMPGAVDQARLVQAGMAGLLEAARPRAPISIRTPSPASAARSSIRSRDRPRWRWTSGAGCAMPKP
jgi:hypothetical protein